MSPTGAHTAFPDGGHLLEGYQPQPGVPDEMIAPDGSMRYVWAPLVTQLSMMTPEEVEGAFAHGHQHLANSGVFFRHYGDPSGAVRDWPLNPVPVVLHEAEWRKIEEGLVQRAGLLDLVAQDLYGENRLIAEGKLPARLIASNPEWLRPMVGIKPRGGHFLNFIAFEIGRGPDGRWWVLEDRVDAPSGAGFALENRIATNCIFPQLHRASRIRRLAGFFEAFRSMLDGLSADGTQAGVLTPGPNADTYDEHAYLARYLGMPLLEGEDLLVDGGELKVRTVDGLVPINVLWRRMDGIWSDPLELASESQLGTPGLVSVIRQGKLTMVNALGSGVLETQALMAFLPQLSRSLTGEALKLPNLATWWCGQPSELAHVRAHADRMLIGPALSTRMPYETDATYALGGRLRGPDHGGDLDRWLVENADGLVAKELATLSTTPVYQAGGFVPRPMSLRVFLARTENGWQMMPGGFARISGSSDPTAVSMRNGGTVSDVWVVSDTPVAAQTLIASGNMRPTSAHINALPAQAADNLFWVGRYTERTEHLLRMVRAYNIRLDEPVSKALMKQLRKQLAFYGVKPAQPFPKAVLAALDSAVNAASQIRDRFNVDAWAALMDMQKSTHRISRRTKRGADAASVMSVMLRKSAGFSGLVHDNMARSSSWNFLMLGRSLERASNMASLLAVVTSKKAPEGGLDLAIEVGDSIILHHQKYALFTSRESVIDLLACDPTNPRSIAFHLDVICKGIQRLSQLHSDQRTDELLQKATDIREGFAARGVMGLSSKALWQVSSDLLDLSTMLNTIFIH